jgi:hypothetical protein
MAHHLQRARLHDLFLDARRQILNGQYLPTSAFFRHCVETPAHRPAVATPEEAARQKRRQAAKKATLGTESAHNTLLAAVQEEALVREGWAPPAPQATGPF